MQAIEVYWPSLRTFEMKKEGGGGGGRKKNLAHENAKGRSTRTALTSFPALLSAPFGSTIKVVKNSIQPLFVD